MHQQNHDPVHRYQPRLYDLAGTEAVLFGHPRYSILKIALGGFVLGFLAMRVLTPRIDFGWTIGFALVWAIGVGAYFSLVIDPAVPFKGWVQTRRNEAAARALARCRARAPRSVTVPTTVRKARR